MKILHSFHATFVNIYIHIVWGLQKPCNSGKIIYPFYEGNPMDLHYPLLKSLGRVQDVVLDEIVKVLPRNKYLIQIVANLFDTVLLGGS